MSDIMKYKTFDFKRLSSGLNTNGVPAIDNLGASSKVYNFSYDNDRLKDCFGIKNFYFTNNGVNVEMNFPTNVVAKKMFSLTFKDEALSCLVVIASNLKAYMWKYKSTSGDMLQIPFTVQSIPSVFNYVDENSSPCIACSFDGRINVYHIDSDTCDFVFNTYSLSQVSFLDDCVVGLLNDDPYSFWYSTSMFPKDWVTTGDVCTVQKVDTTLGKCLRIFKMEENLYLVREYGIQRLVFDVDSNKYQVQNVGQSIGRIFSESICQNGAKIIFLTTSGLYESNGSTVKRIFTNVEHMLIGYDNTATICQNGKYYISTKFNFGDTKNVGIESNSGHKNNVLICIDLETKLEKILRGVDVVQLIDINTSFLTDIGLMVFDGSKNHLSRLNDTTTLYSAVLPKHWTSIPTDFGMPEKKKFISKFFITTKQALTLTLVVDKHKYVVSLSGSEHVQVIRPNLSGYTFSYSIDAQVSNSEIYGMKVLVGYVD